MEEQNLSNQKRSLYDRGWLDWLGARTGFQSLFFAIAVLTFVSPAAAQDAVTHSQASGSDAEVTPEDPYQSPSELKKLSLEALADVEVTSASRRPEPLFRTSAAVSVLTGDEIERGGAMNLQEALRLAPEMQVAQIDGHSWAISTRGFNIPTANKLQVLMDGRSLYTPLYSGVFWDVQQTFLPDLEQIEIIRGPGATLWGANAVNGVINFITKSSKDTQGLLVEGAGGNELTGFGGIRYGGTLGRDTYYRAYFMHSNRDSLHLERGGDAQDETKFSQGGFRIDSIQTADTLTLQGDIYSGEFGQRNADDIEVDGGNVLGRWTHQFDKESSLMVQAYFDRTHRFVPNVFEEYRDTFDIEAQRRIVLGSHDIVFGGDYRLSADDLGNFGRMLAFVPDSKTVHLISGYIQDEWHVVPDEFSLTAGSKFEHNTFSGFEFQPTGRLTWTPTPRQTVWSAISRAVRTPTRVDQNFIAPNPATPGGPILIANPDYQSEKLIAYELGYRVKPTDRLSLDLAAYYNDYTDLRSLEPVGPGGSLPFTIQNKIAGNAYGGTIAVKWRPTDWWQVDGSLSLLQTDFHRIDGGKDPTNGASEGNDPNSSFVIHSMMDLPGHVKFDTVLRYVDELPRPNTPSYFTADMRIAWSPTRNLEIAVVGRDLLDSEHPEFRGSTITREVGRSVFATVKWTY